MSARPGRVVLAGLAAVATAAAFLAVPRTQPAPEELRTDPALTAVTRTVLGCPPGRSDAVVKTAAAALPGSDADRVQLTLDPTDAATERLVLERGASTSTPVEGAGVVVRGQGGSARGLLAVRGERTGSTLVAGGCRAPRPEWWFAGAGAGIDHSSTLFLTNVDAGPAVVDVVVHGARGSVDESGTRGITVGPGESLRLPLVDVAPGSEELTVHVTSTQGRVVAHLLDIVRSETGEGREWLPAAALPAGDSVLAGVPADADRVRLLVTNPGDDQAVVELQVVTADGAFVPLGSEQLSIDPGAVGSVDLTEALDGRAAAVRLRSEVPVIGTVRASRAGDVGYAGAAPPLEGPTGLLLVGERSVVQVVGGDEPATLQLSVLDTSGEELLSRAVTAPPSGLVLVPVPDAAAYVVLQPRSSTGTGSGYAAAVHLVPGVAVQPVTPLPTTELRTVVTPYTGTPGDSPP